MRGTKMRPQIAILCCLAVIGCATTPQRAVVALDMTDPLYTSEGCVQMRSIAMQHDNGTLSRAGFGMASGLLLGPFGLIPAIMADSSANDKRATINAELTRQCVTPGRVTPISTPMPDASSDKKTCTTVDGKVVCE